MVLAFCEVCFQMQNGFSTQLFFLGNLYGMYNTVFTTITSIIVIRNWRMVGCLKDVEENDPDKYQTSKSKMTKRWGR